MEQIILASGSPRRNLLSNQIGLDFRAVPSRYEEDMTLDMPHEKLAVTLALGKAREVASREKGVILGMDTFVVFENKRLGKPHTEARAREMLHRISGKVVDVYTGIAVIGAGGKDETTDYEITKVKMAKISEKEIDAYLATGEPLDKAGAFAAQEKGAVFIESVNGCFSNVVGMPIRSVYLILKKAGVDVTGFWAPKK